MPTVKPKRNTFNSGEWRPELRRRDDLDQFPKACTRVENFIPQKFGGAFKRRGFEYMWDAYDVTRPSRLERFVYDNATPYHMEFSNQRIRFIKNAAILTDIASPFLEADIFDLKFNAKYNVTYITHGSYAERRLDRNSDASWSLYEPSYKVPPLRNINESSTTMQISHTTGTSRTLTASAAFFDGGHEGAYFGIEHPRTDITDEGNLTTTTTSSVYTVQGDWSFTTRGTWTGKVEVQRSFDDGTTWQAYRVVTSANDNNERVIGTEVNRVKLRFVYTHTSGDFGYYWNIEEYFILGLCKVTEVLSSTVATVDITRDFVGTTATKDWYEGAFSDYRGHPIASIYYGGRRWLLRDQEIYGTVVEDYENFERTGLDDGGIRHELNMKTFDVIRWAAAEDEMIIGTSRGIYTITKPTTDEFLSPSNIRDKFNTGYSCGSLDILQLDNVLVFAERENRKLRELSYSVENLKYNGARELTLLSGHITGTSGLKQMAAQQHPATVLWGVRNDGGLISFTYEKDESVYAFARHNTQGTFVSITTADSSVGEELWVCVKRTVNGSDKYYIERMQSETVSTNTVVVEQSNEEVTVKKMQLSVLFDNTSSMSSQLATFKANLSSLVSGLNAIVSELEISLCLFKDEDEVVIQSDFVDYETFVSLVNAIAVSEGDDTEEAGYHAIVESVSAMSWRTTEPQWIKSVLLITDAPSHERGSTQAQAIAALQSIDAKFYYGFASQSTYNGVVSVVGGVLVTDAGDFATDFVNTVITTQFTDLTVTETRPVDYLDSSKKITGSNITAVTGAGHLEGMTVYAMGDGALDGIYTVSSGGFTLNGSYSDVRYGLLYEAYLQPMPFEFTFGFGSTRSNKKSMASAWIDIYESLYAEFGSSEKNLKLIDDSAKPSKLDSPPPLVTDVVRGDARSGHEHELNVLVASRQPYPLNINGIYPVIDVKQ